jgi:hypothetical protein
MKRDRYGLHWLHYILIAVFVYVTWPLSVVVLVMFGIAKVDEHMRGNSK